MAATKGNKYAKGNKGGGRKGYGYEKNQLERMRKLLNGVLTLAEKIQQGKATKAHMIRFDKLLKIALKIMDKLHANRQRWEGEDSEPILPFIIKIEKMDDEKQQAKSGVDNYLLDGQI